MQCQQTSPIVKDVAELEDDILCFLPTVSDLEVFRCELDLLDLNTQQPLPEAFRTALLQWPQLQIVVRPCMVDGHSIWPKAVVFRPTCVGSFLCCTLVLARRRDNGHSTCRNCGLAELSATANCQASTLGHKSGGRDFPGVPCAARGGRSGCVQYCENTVATRPFRSRSLSQSYSHL